MPTGYLWSIVIPAVYTVAALWPIRQPPFMILSFMLGYLVNELPFVAFYWLVGSSLLAFIEGDLMTPLGFWTLGFAAVATLGLVEILRRESLAGAALERALDRDLGTWRLGVTVGRIPDGAVPNGGGLRSNWRRLPRILFTPFPIWTRGVKRVRNLRYGNAGRRNRLDVYRPGTTPPGGSPVLIHFHGGHFAMGSKSREARPLLHRLARNGWVCISANYRLRGAGRFPNSQVDAKRVIAWARANSGKFGIDGASVVVAGSSAGAHLAAMCGLTPNDVHFQPGFENADTAVAAVVSFYGYLGPREFGDRVSSDPSDYVRADAPPFFLAHGIRDSVVPVEWMRNFVAKLRGASEQSVVYTELPGAQHSFDLFRSLRFEKVVDAVEVFLANVVTSTANDSGSLQANSREKNTDVSVG